MKTSQRHHLKDNELAIWLAESRKWYDENQNTIIAAIAAIVIVGGGVAGYTIWKGNTDGQARTMLASAMVIEESRIAPPLPPAGTTNDPNNVGGQAPGTYPTEKAKLEAALPKFLAAADAYPTNEAGITARYHAAGTLVGLGRFDEAQKQYDQVAASNNAILAKMAKLGKAQAQIRAGQFDPAIATLKQLSEVTDPMLPAEGILMELARAYTLAGKTEDAKRTLTLIVEKHADSPFAADARTELDKSKS